MSVTLSGLVLSLETVSKSAFSFPPAIVNEDNVMTERTLRTGAPKADLQYQQALD